MGPTAPKSHVGYGTRIFEAQRSGHTAKPDMIKPPLNQFAQKSLHYPDLRACRRDNSLAPDPHTPCYLRLLMSAAPCPKHQAEIGSEPDPNFISTFMLQHDKDQLTPSLHAWICCCHICMITTINLFKKLRSNYTFSN